MDPTSETAAPEYLCPHCGGRVAVTAMSAGEPFRCAHCGGEFTVPTNAATDPRPPRDDGELDAMRIQQMIRLRRGLHRGRSYALIAAVACAGAAAQCAYLAWQQLALTGGSIRAGLFILLMIAALGGAAYFGRRASALHREAMQTHLPEPAAPPDFSTLSDGSQRARELENLR